MPAEKPTVVRPTVVRPPDYRTGTKVKYCELFLNNLRIKMPDTVTINLNLVAVYCYHRSSKKRKIQSRTVKVIWFPPKRCHFLVKEYHKNVRKIEIRKKIKKYTTVNWVNLTFSTHLPEFFVSLSVWIIGNYYHIIFWDVKSFRKNKIAKFFVND